MERTHKTRTPEHSERLAWRSLTSLTTLRRLQIPSFEGYYEPLFAATLICSVALIRPRLLIASLP